MILVDTSSWIHRLRPDGDQTVRARVERALSQGEACWCPIVRLELWNGAGGEREKKILREFEQVLPELAITADVWDQACELSRRARVRGSTVPATELAIATCAQFHGADLETADADFAALGKLPAQ